MNIYRIFLGIFIFSLMSNNVFAGWDTAKRRTLNKLESAINKNLDNTEVTITSQERNKLKFEILTLQPLA